MIYSCHPDPNNPDSGAEYKEGTGEDGMFRFTLPPWP